MTRRKIALIIIALIVVALVALAVVRTIGKGDGDPKDKKDDKPVPVTVVPVAQKSVPVYLFAQGTVRARRTVDVQPRVGGLLLSINFNEGERVEKGQVLATIDPRSYQAQYNQALARKNQNLALLATARSNLKRSRDLYKQSYISKQDLTKLVNTVNQYQAAVAADKAALRDAELQLEYTKVRAPINGLAGLRQVDAGNMITTGNSIVVLTQTHPVNLLFSLPAGKLGQVRKAQAAGTVAVAALASADHHLIADDGRLVAIGNRIDSASGTFQLKAAFPNQDDALWPGQFVRVRLRTGTVEDGLVIPTQAVQRGPDGEYVYLLEADDSVRMQPVTAAGGADIAHTLISSGLAAGDKVVTEGAFRLKPGSKVVPLAPGEVPPPPEPEKHAGDSGHDD